MLLRFTGSAAPLDCLSARSGRACGSTAAAAMRAATCMPPKLLSRADGAARALGCLLSDGAPISRNTPSMMVAGNRQKGTSGDARHRRRRGGALLTIGRGNVGSSE